MGSRTVASSIDFTHLLNHFLNTIKQLQLDLLPVNMPVMMFLGLAILMGWLATTISFMVGQLLIGIEVIIELV